MVTAKTVQVKELKASQRFDSLKKLFLLKKKKLLLIRPRITGDAYTEIGSYNWAGEVKQKAVDEGWDVLDLSINNATREKIEEALNDFNPTMIIHYDHGSSFTLWGQESNASEPGIDELNVDEAAGTVISTVSCQSASGLGPAAISEGVKSYIGYTENHAFVMGRDAEFGTASNAANFALLEGKTTQEAFDIGWAAYDALVDNLLAMDDDFSAAWAMHDRDCLALLGDVNAKGYTKEPALHCIKGGPDSVLLCKIGLPNSSILCKLGLPDLHIPSCKFGLPNSVGPEKCLAGPYIACGGGPIFDIPFEYLDVLQTVDWDKIPSDMKKSFQVMIDKMRREGSS